MTSQVVNNKAYICDEWRDSIFQPRRLQHCGSSQQLFLVKKKEKFWLLLNLQHNRIISTFKACGARWRSTPADPRLGVRSEATREGAKQGTEGPKIKVAKYSPFSPQSQHFLLLCMSKFCTEVFKIAWIWGSQGLSLTSIVDPQFKQRTTNETVRSLEWNPIVRVYPSPAPKEKYVQERKTRLTTRTAEEDAL